MNQTKLNQTKPNQTKPNQTEANQTEANQTKPKQTEAERSSLSRGAAPQRCWPSEVPPIWGSWPPRALRGTAGALPGEAPAADPARPQDPGQTRGGGGRTDRCSPSLHFSRLESARAPRARPFRGLLGDCSAGVNNFAGREVDV